MERTVRQKESGQYVFWFNNTEKKQDFVSWKVQEGKTTVTDRAILEPFEMAIIKEIK